MKKNKQFISVIGFMSLKEDRKKLFKPTKTYSCTFSNK